MAIEHPEKWRFSLLGKSSNYCWVIFQQAMFEDSGGYTLSYGNVDRRKFRSQISTRWKSRGGKSQRRERVSRKKIRKEKESEERRCETLFFHVFPMFCGPGEPKSRLAEAAGAEPSAEKR